MPGKQVAIYTRVSTHDQQTLPLQLKELRRYAKQRGWRVVMQIQEIGSGVKERPKRDALLQVARRREVDTVLVWRLDRWGRSVEDLVRTLRELQEVGVGFVSFKEALDLRSLALVNSQIESQMTYRKWFFRERVVLWITLLINIEAQPFLAYAAAS